MSLSREGEVASELSWRSEQNHSVELVPSLRLVMKQAKVGIGEIEAIFVARGPGGFSALRVGISTAKGLAMAHDIPLVAVGTLDVEAGPYLGLGRPVRAVVGAGRDMVYTASYSSETDSSVNTVEAYRVETFSELAASLEKDALICGEAAQATADAVKGSTGVALQVAGLPPPTRRPAILAKLAYRRLMAGDLDDPDLLQPIYIRGSQYEVAQRTVLAAKEG